MTGRRRLRWPGYPYHKPTKYDIITDLVVWTGLLTTVAVVLYAVIYGNWSSPPQQCR